MSELNLLMKFNEKNVIIKERKIKMCMKPVSEVEKKQEIGWKIVKRNSERYVTPYVFMQIEVDKTYHAKYKKVKGIYIFLDEGDARKYKEWMENQYIHLIFSIARVRLGNHIWKVKSVSQYDTKYFYTTNAIEVLDIKN